MPATLVFFALPDLGPGLFEHRFVGPVLPLDEFFDNPEQTLPFQFRGDVREGLLVAGPVDAVVPGAYPSLS